MTPKETFSIVDIPESLRENFGAQIWHYTVGFLRLMITGRFEDAVLLGSGILVRAGEVRAILTAHHVLEKLPKFPKIDRLGLILTDKLERTTIETIGIEHLKIARGDDDALGPDIAAVILSDHIASTLESKKSFYNLDKQKERLLEKPPEEQEGIWIAQGFVDEMTIVDPESTDSLTIKAFCQFSSGGGVEEYPSNSEYDYYVFPLDEPPSDIFPTSFGGNSGGGLWQVTLKKGDDDQLAAKEILLRGILFYQRPLTEGPPALKCHGTKSVYEIAYSAVRSSRE